MQGAQRQSHGCNTWDGDRLAGEEWYLDPVDVLAFEKVATNRWNIVTAMGTGHTVCSQFAKLMGA